MDKIQKIFQQDYNIAEDKNTLLEILEIGRKKGFQDIQIRKKIWPILLQLNLDQKKQSNIFGNWNISHTNKQKCKDYDIILKDVDRICFFQQYQTKERYKQQIQQERIKKKKEVTQIMNNFLLNNPNLSYFQGFHDIVMVVLKIFGEDSAYHIIDKLAHCFLIDYFTLPFQNTLLVIDKIIFQIVMRSHNKYQKIFKQFDKQFGFTIPWIITWFSHTFHQISIIIRLWDYLLCSTPDKIVHLCSAFIICLTQQLTIQFNQKNKQYDYANIFEFYQDINRIPVRMETIIIKCQQLQSKFQINTLDTYKSLNQRSIIIESNYIQLFPLFQYKKKVQFIRQKSKEETKKMLLKGATFTLLSVGLLFLLKKNSKSLLKEIL